MDRYGSARIAAVCLRSTPPPTAPNTSWRFTSPRKACDRCKALGYEWYETAAPDQFDTVILQDRAEDKYLKSIPVAIPSRGF